MAGTSRILLICADEEIARFLREILVVEGGYAVTFEDSNERGVRSLKQNSFDLVFVKFNPTNSLDKELIQNLKKIDPDCIIIAYVENATTEALDELFTQGAFDFIGRPVNLDKLSFLVRKASSLHALSLVNKKFTQGLKEHNASLEKQNILLANRIEDSTKNLTRLYEDLRSTYMRTIKVLAQAIDARDHYTHSHSENVTKYAEIIAREMGLSAREMENIREACELHDLGKIGIVDSILTKPNPLNSEEWEQIKRHPVIGAQILEPLTFLNDVIELIRQHHEHYDGGGYPEGRKGEDILLGARIIHLADAYESMRSARSYRQTPFTKEEAIAEIKRNSGTQFDPNVVKVFLKIVDKIEAL